MPPKIHAMFLHVGTSFFGRLGRFVVAMVGGSPCGLTKTDMNDCVCVRRGGRSTKECYCIINSVLRGMMTHQNFHITSSTRVPIIYFFDRFSFASHFKTPTE